MAHDALKEGKAYRGRLVKAFATSWRRETYSIVWALSREEWRHQNSPNNTGAPTLLSARTLIRTIKHQDYTLASFIKRGVPTMTYVYERGS